MVRLRFIRIKNFRSFGPGAGGKGVRVSFSNRITYLVGENNAGKTNILTALKRFGDIAQGRLEHHDYHFHNQANEMLLGFGAELDDLEFSTMMGMSNMQVSGRRAIADIVLRSLFPSCEFIATFGAGRGRFEWRIGRMYPQGSSLFFVPPENVRQPVQTVTFQRLVEGAPESLKRVNLESIVRSLGLDPAMTAIALPFDINGLLIQQIQTRIGIFDEIRFRPTGTGQAVYESYDGSHVADVLFSLKNGSKDMRERYDHVKAEFTKIFPQLTLEVVGASNTQPRITVERRPGGFENDVIRAGAGIGEVVTLLTHMVGAEGRVFGVDTPESHLHPHALRTLLAFFGKVSQSNQLILTTHSPLVPSSSQVFNTVVIRESQGKTTVHQLAKEDFSVEELRKLEVRLGPEMREFLFSKKVIFVEGDTDLGALPILVRGTLYDPDTLGISFIGIGGKHFGLFQKVATAFGIPSAVICDRDALVNIECQINIGSAKVQVSPVFEQLANLGVLDTGELRLLKKAGGSTKGRGPVAYPPRWFRRLSQVAERHNIFAWDTDIEGVLEPLVPRTTLAEINRASKSKVIRGRLLAQAILDLGRTPRWLENRIVRILTD